MDYYATLDDEAVQKLAAGGDRLAEEALAKRYMRLVRVCARPLFLAGGDSEDLIQEGMFGLLSAIRQFDSAVGCPFYSFAEQCIKKRLYSAVKSASRLKHFPLNDGMSFEQLSEDFSTQLSAIPDFFRPSPEDEVLAKESKEELYSVFSRSLSKLENMVLTEYLNGFSYREIAVKLNKDEKAIDNAVQRIRRKLARNLKSGDISLS